MGPAEEDKESKKRKKESRGHKKDKETPQQKAEKSRRRKYRWRIIAGLMLPFTLQALDTTIIASALPYIAEDFGMFFSPSLPSSQSQALHFFGFGFNTIFF